jgi:hypothetical protein
VVVNQEMVEKKMVRPTGFEPVAPRLGTFWLVHGDIKTAVYRP